MPHGKHDHGGRPANKRNRDPSAVANYKPCCDAVKTRSNANVKSPAGAGSGTPSVEAEGY
jgi:hypothetical protein